MPRMVSVSTEASSAIRSWLCRERLANPRRVEAAHQQQHLPLSTTPPPLGRHVEHHRVLATTFRGARGSG